jgi:transcriptional regulator GlxA family with amidase domain
MDRVKELLTKTNFSIKQIAAQSGIENVRYLTQIFRDQTGQTPTEYRRTQSSPQLVP